MTLIVEKLSLGPLETNCFIIADSECNDCVVIDPAWDANKIIGLVNKRGWNLQAIWLTHSHFDHFGALGTIIKSHPDLPLGLHVKDLPLYQAGGGAANWGIPIDNSHQPTLWFDQTTNLSVGMHNFIVLFVPGHSPGHVAFLETNSNLLFGGDVLFQGGIGRTDLYGGDFNQLINSIKLHFLTLPNDTVVYPGHGSNTTILAEKQYNPYLT
ncbi:MAG: MBL fold metallo-hydrolase [Chloroflexota bacterium]|nr:MBL fold metallo-hydrolase [Chloroflexota bacterium]